MARAGRVDIMLAMNNQTYKKDLADLAPGGYLIYDSTWPRHKLLARDDVTIIGIPLAKLCNEQFSSARARVLMKNIAYVGAVAALLDIDLDVIKTSLNKMFAKKASLLEGNHTAFRLGYEYVKHHFDCPHPRSHYDRWQYHGGTRCGLCRGNGWCVVSNHAVHVSHG